MTAVLVLVFLVLIGAGVAALVRSRSTSAVGPGTPPERSLGTSAPAVERRSSVRGLRLGDVVAHDGHDSIVERSYRFDEGGSRWEEHLLVDGDYRRWLSVEDDEGLECVLWERRPDPDLEPGPKTIDVDGVSYAFEERGTADYTLEEAGGGPGGSGRAEYADYAAGEQRLSFERYDGSGGWEVNVGAVISEHAFDVYPGSTS